MEISVSLGSRVRVGKLISSLMDPGFVYGNFSVFGIVRGKSH